MGDVVLRMEHITRDFPGVRALDDVTLEAREGEVLILAGENGAGKSTLMKVLSGVWPASSFSGRILIRGEERRFASTHDAEKAGVAIIHQELNLIQDMSVGENIFLDRYFTRAFGIIDWDRVHMEAAKILERLHIRGIGTRDLVRTLSVGKQQMVEIAKALSIHAKILIMDEPTSALSASEVEVLFKVIRDLKSRGVSIVYISHHLEEALQITDHAVVLRDGNMTAKAPRAEIDLEWIVRNMVGDNYNLGSPPTGYEFGDVALSIEDAVVTEASGANVVDHMSLNVRAGEIVCIYGLMGAGRTELLEAVAGRGELVNGRVLLEGQDMAGLTIAERIARGLSLVPEDRQRDGLVQTMSVGQNLSLASIGAFVKGLFTSAQHERTLVDDSIRRVTIKTKSGAAAIGSLSGGNQQKVVIGKMLATHPKVLLLDEPSRGIDIGAKAEVFRLVAEGARQGLAVIYSTSEVGECLSVAHRIIVMRRGRISAEFDSSVSKEEIMAASGEAVVE